MNPNLDSANCVYKKRRENLRNLLKKDNLDALIVLSPANRFYLSGFELHDGQPDESSGLLIISTCGEDWLITDSRYEIAAKSVWPEKNVRIYSGNIASQTSRILKKYSSSAGFEGRYTSISFLNSLKKELKRSLPVLRSVDGMVEKLRMIKEPCEIDALEKSFLLNHAAIKWLDERQVRDELAQISEKQLAWEIEKFFRENGADELAFATIVAEGREAAKPHAKPDDRIIGTNTGLLVDLGCRVDNYCSDQTRAWWLGSDTPKFYKNALDLVKEAQAAALNIMKPGIPCSEVYHAAKNVFEKAGAEKYFTHGLGHGVGLQTHEAPSLSPRSSQKLETGMVVTVEPGLYYPEWGGVRWEYTVVIENNGPRIL